MTENKTFKYATIGVIAFWLIVFAFLPNVLVFIVSFTTRDELQGVVFRFTLENYQKMLEPQYRDIFINSLKLAFIATAICLVLAFPFSYILSRLKGNKNIFLLLIIIPFWTSALIRIYAIKIILTTNGLINYFLIKFSIIKEPLDMLYTNSAIILGFVYTLLPYMILPLYASLEKLDRRYIEAANDLGANRFYTFTKIIIPLSVPGIIAGSLLVFLPALGLFYISDMLGGSKILLIGNVVKNQFTYNWPFGAAISVTLTLIMGVLLIANFKSLRSASKRGIL